MTIMQQLCIASMTPSKIMLWVCAGELLSVPEVSTDAEGVTALAVATACVIRRKIAAKAVTMESN